MKLFPRQIFLSITYAILLLQVACQRVLPPGPMPQKVERVERLTIGHIRNTRGMMDACGCALQFPVDGRFNNGSSIFVSDLNGAALMNISGRDTLLRVVSYNEPQRQLRRGDRFYGTYVGGDLTVRINFVVTDACNDNPKKCRFSSVNATITVISIRLRPSETPLPVAVPRAVERQERRYSAIGTCGCQ